MGTYEEQQKNTFKKVMRGIAISIASIFVLALLVSSVYLVPPGNRGVLVTLGKVAPRSYVNGIGFKWPIISQMVNLDVRTQKFADSTETYTSDIQTAGLRYVFTYELNPANVNVLYETIGMDYESKIVTPILDAAIKDVIGKWPAQELVSNRDVAASNITACLKERMNSVFIQNLSFVLRNVGYSDNFEKSIEDKVIAEQKAQEAVNNTKRIQEEAQQTVIAAKAEAEAMEIKSQALAKNKGLTEYEAVLRWDGKLPQYMMGNAVPFLNLGSK